MVAIADIELEEALLLCGVTRYEDCGAHRGCGWEKALFDWVVGKRMGRGFFSFPVYGTMKF